MASLAHLSREERLGLGVAVVAHVALVGALVWQVGNKPAALPIPERIEVSLAEDVGLTAAAPNPVQESQANIAPELAERPAPQPAPPEPVRAAPTPPRPTVQPRQPVARPTPAPAPRAAARPTPAPAAARPAQPQQTRSGGSRIGSDFLAGSGNSERTEERGTVAAAFGAAEQASLQQAINRQLKPHWSAPSGVDVEKLVTVLRWELNPDGSLKGRPQVVSQSGINDSNRPQAQLHAERAIRAVQLAAPFNLPEEFYSNWRLIRTWSFDRRL